MPLTGLFELDAEPAVSADGRTLSYGELRGAAGGIASRLGAARRVGVWASSTLEAIVASVAVVASGRELVPLNPHVGRDELQHILQDARPDAIVGRRDAGPQPGITCVEVDLSSTAELSVIGDEDPDGIAIVIYTSGTTGPPKGALLPRRAITSNLDALADAWAWTAEDRLTHALPIFHVHGLVVGLLGPLRRGGELVHLGRFSPEAVAEALADGATMLFGVPTMYHRLAAVAEADPAVAGALRSARLLVSGSAALPARTFHRIERACGQRIVERYGLTETIMNTAVRFAGERRPGEVGRPLPGVELRVVTDEGGDAPCDGETMGEVIVRGPNVFLGYLGLPEATATALRDGWFWTGDLAVRAPDGYVRIVGRRSTDLITTGGYKVGAGEVEGALLEHPAVGEVAVAGRPDDDLGERIVAWIVLDDETPEADRRAPSLDELADHVAGRLAPHKRPRQVHVVDALPRNAMGKVVKTRLEEPAAQERLRGP